MAFKRFTIPDSDIQYIKLLARIEFDALNEIEKSLCEEKPTFDIENLSLSIAERLKLSMEIVEPIISILWRFATIQQNLELTSEEFFETLISSLMDQDQLNESEIKQLNERKKYIIKTLSPECSIAYGVKAARLMLEQQLLFCRVKVITDIRPIFNEDVKKIEGFVPFHILSIKYHEGMEEKEIRIAMDFNDILGLQKSLSRAEEKEKLIREFLTEKGSTVIGIS